MSVSFILRIALALGCVLPATAVLSQNLPVIPPSSDSAFWGRANAPCKLKLHVTMTGPTGVLQTDQTGDACRDSTGRVHEVYFYISGKPSTMVIRDPVKYTFTMMQVVTKRASVLPVSRPSIPPPGKGWTVERLPSRVIDGFPAEGFRFTRIIPAPADGTGAPDTMIDEEWISRTLSVVLEQTTKSQRSGTSTKTVSHFEQVEPEASLFTIPGDYTIQQVGPTASDHK